MAMHRTVWRQPTLPGFDVPATTARSKRPRRSLAREADAASAADALGVLTPGCERCCLTGGRFSLVDVLRYVLDATGPADVVLSTWTAAEADLSAMHDLLRDGRLRSLRLIVDPTFAARQPALAAAVRRMFGPAAICETPNHAKLALIRNADWNVVLRGSMNLSAARRMEWLELSDDADLADWLAGLMDGLFAAAGE